MNKKKFATRQVHLDFHTSPFIPGIGSKFNKEQFQAALKKGNIESITVFAKCHNSMCYYPTQIGEMHPELNFDLTGAMVEAAHEIGVKAPIYITAGWSEKDALAHPEWRAMVEDGEDFCSKPTLKEEIANGPDTPRSHVAWHFLCLNDGNEYTKYLYALTEEVCKRYKKVDGLFFDICMVGETCLCESCKNGMSKMGLNPFNEDDNKKYFIEKRKAFMSNCENILHKYHPDATIFFNSGGADQYRPQYHENQTHFEMEDLPTAWGGYDKMPIRAKFFSKTGKPFLGMTGKFHLDWGEFGGFKSGDALKYEITTMALYGAGCSIGDHLHPDGEMEMQTYENIGVAFDYLEKISPFCYGGKSTAKIGLFLTDKKHSGSSQGVSNILIENQIDYDIVTNDDFSAFDTIIFPDSIILNDNALTKLNNFLANSGKVLFMGDALVKNGKFQIDCGAEYVGRPEFDCDYIISEKAKENGLPNAPMLCNIPSERIKLTDGELLAQTLYPYFSRTVSRFSGHKNTPHNKNGEYTPAIVKKGNVVYMAHPMSKLYYKMGSIYQKRYFMMALYALKPKVAFSAEGLGAQGKATMIKQDDQNRYCLNMTYAAPVRRGCAEIIEDIADIYNVKLTLYVNEQIKKAYNGVSKEEFEIITENNTQSVIVPKFNCHASIVFEY